MKNVTYTDVNGAAYTDEELRFLTLPLAVGLVNQEFYRTMQKCNTTEIANIVNEFVNVIKYGSVNALDSAVTEAKGVEEVRPKKAKKETYGSAKLA